MNADNRDMCRQLTSARIAMHSSRLGLVLIVIGTALPLVCLPLVDGYSQKSSLLANIQKMSLPVTRDRMEPIFREDPSLDSDGEPIKVSYGENGTILGFPNSMSDDDIAAAIRAAIKAHPRFQTKQDLPKFMRFYGWKVARHGHGLSVPFKHITSLGLLFAFSGMTLLVVRATGTRHGSKTG